MIHCPPASITSTVLRSSSSMSCGSAPTLLIRLPSMTMASLRAAGRPEPSIRVPLRTTRVFLLAALMMISLSLIGRSTLPPNGPPPQPQSACHASLSLGERRGVVSTSRIGLIFRSRGGIPAMADKQYDRSAQDLGNIVNLGHVNVCISDQHLATHYYVTGLGLTRDPFLNTSARNMWVNVGMSQFHLPTGQPDVLRGVTGLVVLGMPYIAFDVRPGTADRIARFYREVMGALATVIESAGVRKAGVQVGGKQYWYFRETDEPEKPYDRHHAQVYIANFSGPYRRLKELGLLTAEVNDHEYRFKDVVDLDTREVLFTVEHEVRSQTHPLYGRPLVNRDPAQSNRNYKPGHDSMSWAMA